MVDEPFGLRVVELGEETGERRRVAVSHLLDGWNGGVRQGHDDAPAVAFVVLALDQPRAGELAHDETRVREAHVHPIGELGHGGRACHRERHERTDVAFSEAAGFLQGRRELSATPPQRDPELGQQRRETSDVATTGFIQVSLTI